MDLNLGYQISVTTYEAENGDRFYFLVLFCILYFDFDFFQLAVAPESNFPRFCHSTVLPNNIRSTYKIIEIALHDRKDYFQLSKLTSSIMWQVTSHLHGSIHARQFLRVTLAA